MEKEEKDLLSKSNDTLRLRNWAYFKERSIAREDWPEEVKKCEFEFVACIKRVATRYELLEVAVRMLDSALLEYQEVEEQTAHRQQKRDGGPLISSNTASVRKRAAELLKEA